MSEYWKSTPKYWCKFCQTFVKDTKLERQQHDATPRHQNNIQKSLRSLHKEKEIEDRQKQRAKDEVARLNGLTGASSSSGGGGSKSGSGSSAPPTSGTQLPKKATFEERKRQMQQLADMGIAVPEEFRKEMGMAGDWQTVKVTRVERPPQNEDSKDAVAFGFRKRKFEDQEEEEAIMGTGDATLQRKNRNWGARMKSFPGSKKSGDDDLDALLGGVLLKKKGADEAAQAAEDIAPTPEDDAQDGSVDDDVLELKQSESHEEQEAQQKLQALQTDPPVKKEEPEDGQPQPPAPGAGIVFKKRKKITR